MVDKLKSLLLNLSWVQVVIGIVLGGGLSFFLLDQSQLSSRQDSIVEAKNQIDTMNKKIEEAKKFELEFEARKKGYAEMVKKLQEMQGALPKQFSLPDLLNDLMQEAKLVDLDVTNLNPDNKEEKKELYSTLGVSIDIKSTFLQILVFLDRLANMKRLVGVSSISIGKEGDATVTVGAESGGHLSAPALHARIKVLAYRYNGN